MGRHHTIGVARQGLWELSADGHGRQVPSSSWKEQSSRHLVGLIANDAHCHVTDWAVDYQGIDLTLVSGDDHLFPVPRLDLQLKASSSAHVARRLASGNYSLSLAADAYREMRRPRLVPLLVVVLILPEGTHTVTLTQGEAGGKVSGHLLLWSDPTTWPDLDDEQQGKAIEFPRENEFTSAFLGSRMKEIGNGGAR